MSVQRFTIALGILLGSAALAVEEFSVEYDGGWDQSYEVRFDVQAATISYSLTEQGTLPGIEIIRKMTRPDEYSSFLDSLIHHLKDIPGDGAPPDDHPFYTFTWKGEAGTEPVSKSFHARRRCFEFSLGAAEDIAKQTKKLSDIEKFGIVSEVIAAVEALRSRITDQSEELASPESPHKTEEAEQAGAEQSATAPESKSEGKDKPQPESKPAPR